MSNLKPFFEGIDPPAHTLERKTVDIRGRKEHEEWLKDSERCAQAGIDHTYEVMVYLKRWGGWLDEQ